MNSETLSLKTIVSKLGFLEKPVIINETSEKKIYNCLQLNQQKKYLTLVMLKNTITHL